MVSYAITVFSILMSVLVMAKEVEPPPGCSNFKFSQISPKNRELKDNEVKTVRLERRVGIKGGGSCLMSTNDSLISVVVLAEYARFNTSDFFYPVKDGKFRFQATVAYLFDQFQKELKILESKDENKKTKPRTVDHLNCIEAVNGKPVNISIKDFDLKGKYSSRDGKPKQVPLPKSVLKIASELEPTELLECLKQELATSPKQQKRKTKRDTDIKLKQARIAYIARALNQSLCKKRKHNIFKFDENCGVKGFHHDVKSPSTCGNELFKPLAIASSEELEKTPESGVAQEKNFTRVCGEGSDVVPLVDKIVETVNPLPEQTGPGHQLESTKKEGER